MEASALSRPSSSLTTVPLSQAARLQIRSRTCTLPGSLNAQKLQWRKDVHRRWIGAFSKKFKAWKKIGVGRCHQREADVMVTSQSLSSLTPAEQLDLQHFITTGVLAGKVGASPDMVAEELEFFYQLGSQLSHYLKFDEDGLTEAERIRVYQYYLPVFFWCQHQLSVHQSRFSAEERIPPIVIGISAPQGCGKTTLVESLEYLFNSTGRPTAAVSIDDFYLTGADQDKLAADNPDNGLLQCRGNAGSHDLDFGTEMIKTLLKLTTEGSKAKIPRYDKSARNGRGDRGDPSTWPLVEGPLQVLLFEGWMLGFEPQDPSVINAIDPQVYRSPSSGKHYQKLSTPSLTIDGGRIYSNLGFVNKALKRYHDAWHSFVNSWIIVQVGDPSWVFKWRLEAEIQMRRKGKDSMTDDEVADFVSRYMPAYKVYLPSLYSTGPRNSTAYNSLKFNIDKERNPIA